MPSFNAEWSVGPEWNSPAYTTMSIPVACGARENVGFRDEQLNHSTHTLMCWN